MRRFLMSLFMLLLGVLPLSAQTRVWVAVDQELRRLPDRIDIHEDSVPIYWGPDPTIRQVGFTLGVDKILVKDGDFLDWDLTAFARRTAGGGVAGTNDLGVGIRFIFPWTVVVHPDMGLALVYRCGGSLPADVAAAGGRLEKRSGGWASMGARIDLSPKAFARVEWAHHLLNMDQRFSLGAGFIF